MLLVSNTNILAFAHSDFADSMNQDNQLLAINLVFHKKMNWERHKDFWANKMIFRRYHSPDDVLWWSKETCSLILNGSFQVELSTLAWQVKIFEPMENNVTGKARKCMGTWHLPKGWGTRKYVHNIWYMAMYGIWTCTAMCTGAAQVVWKNQWKCTLFGSTKFTEDVV